MTKSALKQNISDAFTFPRLGRGIVCLWRRNFLYFRQTMFVAVAWIFMEPLLYLFALGYGLGKFVTDMNGMSYAQFIAPAMMATSGMYIGFFEGTYSTYTKLTGQRTYQSILLTPVSVSEIVLGEIFWIASKAAISVVTIGTILTFLNLISWSALPLITLIIVVMAWIFAALGIYISSRATSYETFSYMQSGFMTPMSLFCGTYFPLEQLPDWLEKFAYVFPLTHAMQAIRSVQTGEMHSSLILNCLYLVVLATLLTNLAAAKFERRLIV